MTLSSDEMAKINKMNKASQTPSLGTVVGGLETSVSNLDAGAAAQIAIAGASGSHAVVASESNGSTLSIDTGLGAVLGYMTDFYRGGSALSEDAFVRNSSGSLVIEPGSSYAVTTNDVINWLAF